MRGFIEKEWVSIILIQDPFLKYQLIYKNQKTKIHPSVQKMPLFYPPKTKWIYRICWCSIHYWSVLFRFWQREYHSLFIIELFPKCLLLPLLNHLKPRTLLRRITWSPEHTNRFCYKLMESKHQRKRWWTSSLLSHVTSPHITPN